jgi:heat shock protein HslJ
VSSVLADSKITATFDASGSTVSDSASYNNYSGTYAHGDGGALSFSALAFTKMMCADDVMAQETAFLSAMDQVSSYEIEGTQLRLLGDGGAVLLEFDGA